MNLDLVGKNALVCGSTQGIGKAVAIELASLGAKIILIARKEEMLQKTLLELSTNHQQKHEYLVADFSDTEMVGSVITNYINQGNTIHILVNNTGGPTGGKIINEDEQKFIDVFKQHLINNHQLSKAVIPTMINERYGRIINIISTSVKAPLPNLGVSNTIRGAVASWAKTLATEIAGHGITVNNVLPGATATNRLSSIIENKAKNISTSTDDITEEMLAEIPMKRFADASEIAYTVAFLASPSAAYITGINIPVDGGRLTCL